MYHRHVSSRPLSVDAIFVEASLSFVGLGVQPPAASWGTLLKSGYTDLYSSYWYPIFPGLVILIATRTRPRLGGGYLVLLGFAILGLAWIGWLEHAAFAQPAAGSLINDAFSLGMLCVGAGGATWRSASPTGSTSTT